VSHADFEIEGGRRALAAAIRSRIAEYRSEEEARIKRYVAAEAAKG